MADLRNYLIVTATYWVFTVTDGALRMLILLFLHEQGYSPLSLAAVFILYEFCGVITNLIGGFVGSRFGLDKTLSCGLALQILACAALALEADALTVVFVMIVQAMSGVAKDLTKMSAKSYVKLVIPEGDESRLMRWVSLLTGSKNTLKGVGFFVGGLMLTALGFQAACLAMAGALAIALVSSVVLLPGAAGRASDKPKLTSVISRDPRINWLAAARLVLFASRDVWFAVALPVFLASSLGWSFPAVGAFLACWVVGYGIVQASAPRFTVRRTGQETLPPDAVHLTGWTASLLIPLLGIATALGSGIFPEIALIGGLALFGILFAANSAVHSFLIVSYADSNSVAMNVGFYYSANAVGRLLGTLLSGAVFQAFGLGLPGLVACMLAAACFVAISTASCIRLSSAEGRIIGQKPVK
ncbi:organoarsenical effux MFS transporter ArsJ [Myxococcota bacterium]|nr:organoarsenical effux MFS transporter ArsJ [Myxococcota bacterium]